MTNLRNALFVFATSIAALGPIGATAQQPVQVIISGGFSGPYERLVRAFEQASGVKVATGSGASQGSGPQTIAAQLQRGVPADVVILSREGLQDLIAAGQIARGSDVDLARTPLGVAVRAGVAKPAVATVDEFKALAHDSRSFAGAVAESGEAEKARLMQIMMAQDFQDITGQIIKKVVAITQKLERELAQLLVDTAPLTHKVKEKEKVVDLLAGPAVPASAMAQNDVDDLLADLGF